MHTSEVVSYDNQNHYATNVGAVLGEMAIGGGAVHLEEQLSCVSVPSLTNATFVNWEHTPGIYLKSLVIEQLLTNGEEKQLAISNKRFDEEFLAITVVVDGGWSKHAHKHSYNTKRSYCYLWSSYKEVTV